MSAAAQILLAPTWIVPKDTSETIIREVVRECERRYTSALRAIVLAGSMARGEAAALAAGDAISIPGDAEFLLVFRRRSTLAAPAEIGALGDRISRSLRSRNIVCPVHLSGVTPGYLRRLPAHIFSYELRMSGKVVTGDRNILTAIPEFQAREIERADAWHLLSNRMIEWLELLASATDRRQPDIALFYASVKLWMDAATSLLVFLREYEPSYQARAERLAALARAPQPSGLPFPLQKLSAGVNAATSWKLMPEESAAERLGWDFCDQARRYAGILWCWEAAQLTGLDEASAPLTFLRSSRLKKSPWRGWLRTARECRRQHMREPRRRWWALGRWGSPRQCIYAVAAECLLRSGDFQPSAENGLVFELQAAKLRQFLPVPEPPIKEGRGWRPLVRELAWNYHEFVEKTRA
ncbi:MAG TPA: hypothetical protein VNJ52_07165 [Patescibacteria group bacterium]|nr:hypothetical protein [Patescibacteria group bacterium]